MRTISIFRHELQKVQTGSTGSWSPESLDHSRLTHGAINIPQSTIYFFGDSKLVYYKQFRSEHKITWTGARKSPKVRSIPPYITCNNANERLHFLKLHQYIVNIKTCTLLGMNCVADVVRRGRLRWFGHLERKSVDDWVSACRGLVVEGARGRGRSRKTWEQCVRDDMKLLGLHPEWAIFKDMWRDLIWGKRLTLA